MPEDATSLNRLHDIAVPDAISWWPLAPGWIVILLLVLVLALVLGIRRLKNWHADAYRRAALHELEGARSSTAVAEILRRTALAIAPRETVAALRGEAWTDWLSTCGPVPQDAKEALSGAIYDPDGSEGNWESLREFARDWILNHTRPC